MRVIQERDANNTPTVSYTRGRDLSAPLPGGAGGGLEGAGGIGGLLGRSDGYSGGNWSSHNSYHADGNGNLTALVDSSGALQASYRYDSYGNLLSSSGALAGANAYRFSSKEWMATASLYYYGYRFYSPNWQRWLNRDPLEELGGINLYEFVANAPLSRIDPFGLDWSDTGETIWTALGYIVPGGEIPAAAMCASDAAKIIILNKFKDACTRCMIDPPASDPNCDVCKDYEKVKDRLQPQPKPKPQPKPQPEPKPNP